jgi:hypothetical protein
MLRDRFPHISALSDMCDVDGVHFLLQALLKMKKLDIAELERAAES